MKKLKFILFFSLIFWLQIHAQEPSDDPLAEAYIMQLGGGNEIVSISYYAVVNIYKYFNAMTVTTHDTLIKVLQYDPSPINTVRFADIICDDFDHDGISEIASAWSDGNQANWALLKPDQALLGIDSLARWEKTIKTTIPDPALYVPGIFWIMSPVLIQSGNFDHDEQKEIALAYWADNGNVRILVYDVSDTLEITFLGEVMDQEITNPPAYGLCEDQLQLFDIECADFNGDNIDEILLAGRVGSGEGWELFTNIYQWDTLATQLVLKSDTVLYSREDIAYDIANLNIATGNFITGEKEAGVISFLLYIPTVDVDDPDTLSNILIPFETDESLENFTIGEPVYQKQDTLLATCWNSWLSTLICQDVNNDDLDEIISSYSMAWQWTADIYKTLKIFKGTEGPGLTVWADLSELDEEYLGLLSVGDVRIDTAETDPRMELVIQISSHMYEILYDVSGDFVNLEFLDEMVPIDGWSNTEPVQTAELDLDIRLGKPARYSLTKILQPLVILNAPPIHFDVLGGESYDVSLSYNENEGQFISHYEKESSQSTEVTSEFTQDWGTSQTLKAGGSAWGVSVSAYLTTKYGKRFSESGGHSTTVTVSIAVDAREDDRIYATVVDYDLWEYPVYGNNELRGHVMVVRPNVSENRWFPSKSWSGYSYIPLHEVGNILSYREYPLLTDNPEVDEKIKGDYNNSFVLDANSSYDWSLQFDDFETNQASTSKSYSREWGVDVDVWGSGYSLNSSYSKDEIHTHKTDVSSGLNLSVHLDGIDMGLGEVSYTVTPYAYWSTNGALVVDYAVKPELAPPLGTPTWWQVHYGELADPAFILPWRYDPEKGFTLQDEVKRMQTKDILFLPSNPEAGDIILIRARVHNFGLIPTPGLMSVKFYIGDPDSGGTLIVGTGGEEEVFTESAIPARGSRLVEMHWQVPEGATDARIYAVIDQDDVLPEIHENNNKSWAILGLSDATSISGKVNIPLDYSLKQNYPNPFNPETIIEFSLPVAQKVRLDIFNTLGQRVVKLLDKNFKAGKHVCRFDARNLASGVYFYRIMAEKFIQTRKMILLH
jgi:hypothetical protein